METTTNLNSKIENLTLRKRQCSAIVPDTGEQCKRQAVNPGSTQKKVVYDPRTGKRKKVPIVNEDNKLILNNPEFCEMHQPNKIPKCKCQCHKDVKLGPTFRYELTESQIESIKKGTKFITISQQSFNSNSNSNSNFGLKKRKQIRNKDKTKYNKNKK